MTTFVKFDERHFSANELAALWGLCPKTIRSMFAREEGVMVIEQPGVNRRKRPYRTLRIPESVAERVHRRMLRG